MIANLLIIFIIIIELILPKCLSAIRKFIILFVDQFKLRLFCFLHIRKKKLQQVNFVYNEFNTHFQISIMIQFFYLLHLTIGKWIKVAPDLFQIYIDIYIFI